MNFSTPFQTQFAFVHIHLPSSSSFPQQSPQASDLLMYQNQMGILQAQTQMYKQLLQEQEEILGSEPVKKVKRAYNPESSYGSNQNALSHFSQINEAINPKTLTSSINLSDMNEFNYFDQLAKSGIQMMSAPQKNQSELAQSYYASAMQTQQQQMAAMMQNQMMREQAMRSAAQMTSQNQAQAQMRNQQIQYLQNLQQAQKQEEQMAAFQNYLMKNSTQLQQQQQQQSLLQAQLFESMKQAHFQQGNDVNKIYEELAQMKNMQKQATEAYQLEEEYNSVEHITRAKFSDDLDDKKTAETSASNPEEIYFNLDFPNMEFLPNMLAFQNEVTEQRLYEETKQTKSPSKKPETLLNKRTFEEFEKEDKQVVPKKQVPKKKAAEGNLNIQSSPLEYAGQTESKPNSAKNNKAKKEKKVAKEFFSYEYMPIKKERRMNKLQSMKADYETYVQEQKKPYVINLHHDPTDAEQKVVETRKGEAFQAQVAPLNDAPRRSRALKSLWNPSTIDEEKVKQFETALERLYGQEVKNQEAALKLLRGTGMGVEETVEYITNNKMYFQGMLFPEVKSIKTQRF